MSSKAWPHLVVSCKGDWPEGAETVGPDVLVVDVLVTIVVVEVTDVPLADASLHVLPRCQLGRC